MAPGEIYLALFPFGGTIGAKIRPVLTLTGEVGPTSEVLVAYITSVVPSILLPTHILLDPSKPDHVATNLKSPSLLRLHKLATIHGTDFARFLGAISVPTRAEVETKLRLLLSL